MVDEELMLQHIKDLINSKTSIPRPETWYAYHITIQDIEFWIGSQDSFHHRVQYKLNHDVWHHQNYNHKSEVTNDNNHIRRI